MVMQTPSSLPSALGSTSVRRQPSSAWSQAPFGCAALSWSSSGLHALSSAFPCTHTASWSGTDIGTSPQRWVQKSVAPICRAAKHCIGWPSASVPQSGSAALVSHAKIRLWNSLSSTLQPVSDSATRVMERRRVDLRDSRALT